MRKYILLVILSFLCGWQLAHAVPAYPGRITVTQPDGTKVVLSRHGDEWGHYLTDASGRMVRRDADGFYRAVPVAEEASVRNGASARRAQRRMAQAARSQGPVALGQKHFLVILVAFSDLPFAQDDANLAFTNLLNQEGYSVNGGTGSARDYFYENSHGAFEPVFDVYGPFTLPENKVYYGGNDASGNDRHPVQALVEGCRGLDEDIDFTQYDHDGDGVVDLVFMYYAGYGEADSSDEDAIWPHQWSLSETSTRLTLDGMEIDSYACSNELVGYGSNMGGLCGIGTACHEFSHALGLPDFYDTDYNQSNGFAAALYAYSVMCNGSYNNEGRTPPYFNTEERILLGWLEPDEVIRDFEESGPVTLPPVRNDIAYRTLTDMEGEYFLYECRDRSGWDRYIPSPGLIVYHVDRSSRLVHIVGGDYPAVSLWNNWRGFNSINENGSHPCFYIVPAADQNNLRFAYQYSSVYHTYVFMETLAAQIPFPGVKDVTSYTARSWNGVDSEVFLTDIAYSGGLVTFTANVPSNGWEEVNTIADAGSYRAGDRFTFALVEADERHPASIVWYYDDEPAGADSVTLTAGLHTVEARLTYADGSSEVLTLEITVEN